MRQESESNRSNLETRGPGASMAPIDDGRASISAADSGPAIDDRGTEQSEAVQILLGLRDAAFNASDEKLALALGRSSEEIAEWLNGDKQIDSDALMKARALASERRVEL
jgi:hypothetical protein